MPFRLPVDQMKRVDRAAAYCGMTKQGFVQSVVLAEVGEVEERRRHKQLHQVRGFHPEDSANAPVDESESVAEKQEAQGSGILEALRQRKEEENAPAAPPPLPQTNAPVVVNVGNSPTTNGSNDYIGKLADYVVAGPAFERSQRLRTVVGILHASVSTDEERKVLAAQLDAAVATKEGKEENNTAEKLFSGAKFAFDKLSSFLR